MFTSSSAGNTRGLIEAKRHSYTELRDEACLPRGIPAASLKRGAGDRLAVGRFVSSAGNTRGLIEARSLRSRSRRHRSVFRGEYPGPH